MVKRTVDLYGDRIGKVDYVDHLGSDLTCVNAARVSYGKQKDILEEKDKKLIKYLIDNRHDSCFEHCQITFRCKVPLFVRSQHHRHRTQCVSGDTKVTFNRPDRWERGEHCKQSPSYKDGFTVQELYRKWNQDDHAKKRIQKQLLRVYNEQEQSFTVSTIEDIILSGQKELFKVTLENGKVLKCTRDHKVLTTKGWQTLEEATGLKVVGKTVGITKETLFLTNGSQTPCRKLSAVPSKVVKIESLGVQDVYDISVKAPHHNFIADGVVVHNSYNEVSRRYTEDNLQFYEPKEWRVQSKSSKQASESSDTLDHEDLTQLNHANVDYCMKNYHKMLQRGVAKEMARMLLPQNLYTEYYASANLRNWIHFLKLRLHEHAQAEIKEMAEGMKIMLDELYPVTMSMIKW